MRIVGGRYKRRRFDVPHSFNARPTTDFAKENLFNVLSHYLDWEGVRALDLFSGTGSIAVEMLSRGAEVVVSVEQRAQHAAFIRSVARELGEADALRVVQTDVFRYLKRIDLEQEFDFIFADPPYKLVALADLPEAILSSHKLAKGGLLVVEHPAEYHFESSPYFREHRVYGSVNFSFFVFEENLDP